MVNKKYAYLAAAIGGAMILFAVLLVLIFGRGDNNKELRYEVYLSPSTQHKNMYHDGVTTECASMNAVADHLEKLFPEKYTVYRNDPYDTLESAIAHSNKLEPEIHIAIHSNASGVDGGGVRGCEIWIPAGDRESKRLAKAVYEYLEDLTPTEDRGIKETTTLAEMNNVDATRILIEVDFHDDPDGSDWIKANQGSLAQAIYNGISDYYGE